MEPELFAHAVALAAARLSTGITQAPRDTIVDMYEEVLAARKKLSELPAKPLPSFKVPDLGS